MNINEIESKAHQLKNLAEEKNLSLRIPLTIDLLSKYIIAKKTPEKSLRSLECLAEYLDAINFEKLEWEDIEGMAQWIWSDIPILRTSEQRPAVWVFFGFLIVVVYCESEEN